MIISGQAETSTGAKHNRHSYAHVVSEKSFFSEQYTSIQQGVSHSLRMLQEKEKKLAIADGLLNS